MDIFFAEIMPVLSRMSGKPFPFIFFLSFYLKEMPKSSEKSLFFRFSAFSPQFPP